jgi:hypothetical protein
MTGRKELLRGFGGYAGGGERENRTLHGDVKQSHTLS